jgi:hypothetical protein
MDAESGYDEIRRWTKQVETDSFRIADIRLLSLDRQLAMAALSVSEQRLETLRVIVSNILNIHTDLHSYAGNLINFIVALLRWQ